MVRIAWSDVSNSSPCKWHLPKASVLCVSLLQATQRRAQLFNPDSIAAMGACSFSHCGMLPCQCLQALPAKLVPPPHHQHPPTLPSPTMGQKKNSPLGKISGRPPPWPAEHWAVFGGILLCQRSDPQSRSLHTARGPARRQPAWRGPASWGPARRGPPSVAVTGATLRRG